MARIVNLVLLSIFGCAILSRSSMNAIEQTRTFWDKTPCDGQENLALRQTFRYGKEPWLLEEIRKIARRHHHVLELGCGQGTDALLFCRLLPKSGSYIGYDLSPKSIQEAQKSTEEIIPKEISVNPKFVVGNIEKLGIPPNSVECAYSMGVLHHTPNIAGAIEEILNVLRPGGTAYVVIYRKFSPKLLCAHFLRMLQALSDIIIGKHGSFLGLVNILLPEKLFGTALRECLGVPVIRSFTKREVKGLFYKFTIVQITSQGLGLPPLGFNRLLEQSGFFRWMNYFWFVEVKKEIK